MIKLPSEITEAKRDFLINVAANNLEKYKISSIPHTKYKNKFQMDQRYKQKN